MPKEMRDDTEQKGAFRVYLPVRKLVLHNFLGGIAWGLGTVIGATVVVTAAIFLFDALGGVPYVGNLIRELIEQVQSITPSK